MHSIHHSIVHKLDLLMEFIYVHIKHCKENPSNHEVHRATFAFFGSHEAKLVEQQALQMGAIVGIFA